MAGREEGDGEGEGDDGGEEAGDKRQAQAAFEAGIGQKLAPRRQSQLVVAEAGQIPESRQPGADQAGGDGQQEQRQGERRRVVEERAARRGGPCRGYRL